MYIEHPFFYDGKYFAKIDGEFIEITKEVAYAMNNFYRSSKPRKLSVKNERGEIVEKKLREVPYSVTGDEDGDFSIESFPDLFCDVEESVMNMAEQQEVHAVMEQLSAEERLIVYGIYFENKTQKEIASVLNISQQVVAYRLKNILAKMRRMYQKIIF